MRWSRVLAITVLSLSSACGGSAQRPAPAPPASTAPEPPPAATPRAAPDGEPIITDPGAEPRNVLRYRPAVGTHRDAEMDFSMVMDFAGASTAVPPTSFDGKWDVVDVARDGTVTSRFTFGKATVTALPESTPDQVAIMQAEVDQMENLVMTTRTDARGKVLENLIDPRTPEDVRTMVENATTSLTPLPTAPVGRGARWTTRTRKVTDAATYELAAHVVVVGIDGDTVRLHQDITMAITMTENPQITGDGGGHGDSSIDLRTMETDATATVWSHASTPGGELRFDGTTRFRAR